jgi:hypothetical protein
MSNEVQGATLTRPIPGVRTSALFSIAVTLTDAGTVTSIAVPDAAVAFRLLPATDIRFAVGEDPEAVATSGAANDPTDIQVDELSVGGIAPADFWEVRYLPPGKSRSLRLLGASGNEVVDVEFF